MLYSFEVYCIDSSKLISNFLKVSNFNRGVLVPILVFPSPRGYMWTSIKFVNQCKQDALGYFRMMGDFSAILNLRDGFSHPPSPSNWKKPDKILQVHNFVSCTFVTKGLTDKILPLQDFAKFYWLEGEGWINPPSSFKFNLWLNTFQINREGYYPRPPPTSAREVFGHSLS